MAISRPASGVRNSTVAASRSTMDAVGAKTVVSENIEVHGGGRYLVTRYSDGSKDVKNIGPVTANTGDKPAPAPDVPRPAPEQDQAPTVVSDEVIEYKGRRIRNIKYSDGSSTANDIGPVPVTEVSTNIIIDGINKVKRVTYSDGTVKDSVIGLSDAEINRRNAERVEQQKQQKLEEERKRNEELNASASLADIDAALYEPPPTTSPEPPIASPANQDPAVVTDPPPATEPSTPPAGMDDYLAATGVGSQEPEFQFPDLPPSGGAPGGPPAPSFTTTSVTTSPDTGTGQTEFVPEDPGAAMAAMQGTGQPPVQEEPPVVPSTGIDDIPVFEGQGGTKPEIPANTNLTELDEVLNEPVKPETKPPATTGIDDIEEFTGQGAPPPERPKGYDSDRSGSPVASAPSQYTILNEYYSNFAEKAKAYPELQLSNVESEKKFLDFYDSIGGGDVGNALNLFLADEEKQRVQRVQEEKQQAQKREIDADLKRQQEEGRAAAEGQTEFNIDDIEEFTGRDDDQPKEETGRDAYELATGVGSQDVEKEDEEAEEKYNPLDFMPEIKDRLEATPDDSDEKKAEAGRAEYELKTGVGSQDTDDDEAPFMPAESGTTPSMDKLETPEDKFLDNYNAAFATQLQAYPNLQLNAADVFAEFGEFYNEIDGGDVNTAVSLFLSEKEQERADAEKRAVEKQEREKREADEAEKERQRQQDIDDAERYMADAASRALEEREAEESERERKQQEQAEADTKRFEELKDLVLSKKDPSLVNLAQESPNVRQALSEWFSSNEYIEAMQGIGTTDAGTEPVDETGMLADLDATVYGGDDPDPDPQRDLVDTEYTPEEYKIVSEGNKEKKDAKESTKIITDDFLNSITNRVAEVLNDLGFDSEDYEADQTAAIESDYEEAKARLARQFGLDPSGMQSGKAVRAFQLLEADRIQKKADLRRDIQDRIDAALDRELDALNSTFQFAAQTELDEKKLKQDNEQFQDTLAQELLKLGFTEIQVNAAVRQINADIINSQKRTNAEVAQAWAGITGKTGTTSGSLSAGDLGIELDPDDVMYTFMPTTTDANKRFVVASSFEGAVGRAPTQEELDRLMTGQSVEIESMPTLESRLAAAEITQQNMERFAKYSSIAEDNKLQRDEFELAKEQDDRNWNITTGNIAGEFGLSQTSFAAAQYEIDKYANTLFFGVNAEGEAYTPAERGALLADFKEATAQQYFPSNQTAFIQASNLFDTTIGNQRRETALKFGLDADNYNRASKQADQAEERFQSTWASLISNQDRGATGSILLSGKTLSQSYNEEGEIAIEMNNSPSPEIINEVYRKGYIPVLAVADSLYGDNFPLTQTAEGFKSDYSALTPMMIENIADSIITEENYQPYYDQFYSFIQQDYGHTIVIDDEVVRSKIVDVLDAMQKGGSPANIEAGWRKAVGVGNTWWKNMGDSQREAVMAMLGFSVAREQQNNNGSIWNTIGNIVGTGVGIYQGYQSVRGGKQPTTTTGTEGDEG